MAAADDRRHHPESKRSGIGTRRSAGSRGWSQHQAADLVGEAAEQHDQRARGTPTVATVTCAPREAGRENHHLAEEQAEGRRAGDDHGGEHEQERARDRRARERAGADPVEVRTSCAAARASRRRRARPASPTCGRSCAAARRRRPPRRPRPMPTAMMPTCSMLEYASSRFRFHWIRMNGIATSTDSRPSASSRPPENSGPSAAFEIRWMRSRQYNAAVQHADRHQHAPPATALRGTHPASTCASAPDPPSCRSRSGRTRRRAAA